jgi:CRP-like cAMP-binding protein
MKDLLTKIDFFSGLDDKTLKRVADACLMRTFTRNETIVRQGEMGLGLYVISKGRVKIESAKSGLLAELGVEQFFGEMSIVDNKPRSATVTCTEDTECLLLTRDSFVKLMGKYPEIPIRLTRVLAERLRVANEKLAAGPPKPAAAPAGAPPAPAAAPAKAAAPAAPAAAAAPAPAPAPAPAGGESNDGAKGKIKQTLLDVFDSLYLAKAMTRLSVAVLGCPVEGSASNTLAEVRAGDVKVLFFPSSEPVDMRIRAFASGEFTLNVFVPSKTRRVEFGPVPIEAGADHRLSVDEAAGEISLRRM